MTRVQNPKHCSLKFDFCPYASGVTSDIEVEDTVLVKTTVALVSCRSYLMWAKAWTPMAATALLAASEQR